jgi:hypothetical protein
MKWLGQQFDALAIGFFGIIVVGLVLKFFSWLVHTPFDGWKIAILIALFCWFFGWVLIGAWRLIQWVRSKSWEIA